MDTLNAIALSGDGRDPEDALKVLGRIADAFDNPSLHKTDKGLMFVVNVVKSDCLLTSLSSEGRVCQDATYSSCDSSCDSDDDEDAELVGFGDVSVWEHAGSYPYASRRYQSRERRSPSEKVAYKGDGIYDVTKMLLTSSPLDRLDRLARMELKRIGWLERTDKWSVVEMGLQSASLPVTPPKTSSKHVGFRVSDSRECPSSAKMASSDGERQTPHTPRQPQSGGGQRPSKREHGHETLERNRQCRDAIKFNTPTLMKSPAHSQQSDSYLVDFSTLSYTDGSYTNTTTPIRASRLARTPPNPPPQQQARGRLGQVVRNFVRRMLPPSSGGGAFIRSTSCPRARHTGNVKGTCEDSPSARTCQTEMTPRSNGSGESAWTFASASSWMEAGVQGCLDRPTTNRWSGFWH